MQWNSISDYFKLCQVMQANSNDVASVILRVGSEEGDVYAALPPTLWS